jgi:hypothetical protein
MTRLILQQLYRYTVEGTLRRAVPEQKKVDYHWARVLPLFQRQEESSAAVKMKIAGSSETSVDHCCALAPVASSVPIATAHSSVTNTSRMFPEPPLITSACCDVIGTCDNKKGTHHQAGTASGEGPLHRACGSTAHGR